MVTDLTTHRLKVFLMLSLLCDPHRGGEQGLGDYSFSGVWLVGPQVWWWDSNQLCSSPALPSVYPPLSHADGDVADVGTFALDHLPLVKGHFLEVAVTVTKQQKGHSLTFLGVLGVHATAPFCSEELQEA